MRIRLALFFVCACINLTVHAQFLPEIRQHDYAISVQLALFKAGLSEAETRPGAPDSIRPLTSSYYAATSTEFVIAYYYVDEQPDSNLLGPLHVSRFNKRTHRWTHSSQFTDQDVKGSVLGLDIHDRYTFVKLHWNPSAVATVILNRDTLRFIHVVRGSVGYASSGGRVLYEPNERHFAPTHQASLKELVLTTRREVDVFPGAQESAFAKDYRQRVQLRGLRPTGRIRT